MNTKNLKSRECVRVFRFYSLKLHFPPQPKPGQVQLRHGGNQEPTECTWALDRGGGPQSHNEGARDSGQDHRLYPGGGEGEVEGDDSNFTSLACYDNSMDARPTSVVHK